ncbi:CHRD domain-containing protein [Geminicoccus roseus]|uniref:CHRD domain-containing protein n=1 Tax=Geminicoccus roseus TaxID=404900 RepID=UPI000429DFE5|nr:CHRD domain-containing protein [Geminicoccus roseus]
MIRSIFLASLLALAVSGAQAREPYEWKRPDPPKPPQRSLFVVKLDSYQEVPAVVTKGSGTATLRILGQTIQYVLDYRNTESTVKQAHIHIGRKATNGGVSAFLCSNLGNAPAGTPACPKAGKVSGTIKQVGGPAAQGVDNIAELIKAIRAGAIYVNVHSEKYPAGEIRGDLGHGHHTGHH